MGLLFVVITVIGLLIMCLAILSQKNYKTNGAPKVLHALSDGIPYTGRELADNTGILAGSLYPILRQLTEDKLITCTTNNETMQYQITTDGRDWLTKFVESQR